MACSALKPAYRQLLRTTVETGQQQQLALPPTQQQMQATAQHTKVSLSSGQLVHQEQPVGSDPIVFVLLNPPREVLEARLQHRAAAGAHYMPASLLDSQLRQLEVPDPSELYMCFGLLPDACNMGQSGSDGMEACREPAAADSAMSYPTSQMIVAAILSGVKPVDV
jgi:gluconate kinase